MSTRIHEAIRLDKEFYPLTCLQKAISDFSEFLDGSLSDEGNAIIVNIAISSQYTPNSSVVIREFLNYALDLSLKNRFAGPVNEQSP